MAGPCDDKRRTHVQKSQCVKRPEPPVSDDRENHLHAQTLAVVHVRLRRVVAKNAIDDDGFLPVTDLVRSSISDVVRVGPTSQ